MNDSGYLSRLLRSLEGAGLVAVVPSEHDGRVRTARLTPSGSADDEPAYLKRMWVAGHAGLGIGRRGVLAFLEPATTRPSTRSSF